MHSTEYPKLLETTYIRGKRMKTRTFLTGMGLFFGSDMVFNDTSTAFYEERAKNDVGMIITTGAHVSKDHGMTGPLMPNLNNITTGYELQKCAQAVHKYDSLLCVQLLHAGRQTYDPVNKHIYGPSAIAENAMYPVPEELTVEKIKEIQKDFALAAKKCSDAGVDAVEIHAAHGYLLSSFLSPRSNHRTDEYGGSLENRARMVVETINTVRVMVPKTMIVGVKLNATDLCDADGGMQLEEAIEFAKIIEKCDIDFIDVSAGCYSADPLHGTIEPAAMPTGWKESFIKPVKDAVSVPVFAVDTIKLPQQAENALENGVCDYIGLGRALIADPAFVRKAYEGRTAEIHNCIGCLRCTGHGVSDTQNVARCSVNPRFMTEHFYGELKKTGNGRKCAVIGGGPAGIMAAKTLAEKGFSVTLFEAGPALGGSIIPASKAPGKEKFMWTVKSWQVSLEKKGVDIRLNCKIGEDLKEIKALDPAYVILATGSVPAIPGIKGIDNKNVVLATDVLTGRVKIADQNVAILGAGMTGVETAEYLCANNQQITLIDMMDAPAKGQEPFTTIHAMAHLAMSGNVQYVLQHKLKEIRTGAVVSESLETGEETVCTCDTVVLALGVKPVRDLLEKLDAAFENVIIIGDCGDGTQINHAITQAYMKTQGL